jgi:hypothetical protein
VRPYSSLPEEIKLAAVHQQDSSTPLGMTVCAYEKSALFRPHLLEDPALFAWLANRLQDSRDVAVAEGERRA